MILLAAVLVLTAMAVWRVRDAAGPDGEETPRGAADSFPRAQAQDATAGASLEGRAAGTPPEAPHSEPAGAGASAKQAALVIEAVLSGSGNMLPGVNVAVVDARGRRLEGRTDDSGRLEVAELPSGTARVEAAEPGLVAEPTEVDVGGEPARVRLYFLHGVSVGGRVLSVATGRPVAGARVIAAPHPSAGDETPEDPGDAWCVVASDDEGRFTLDAVPKDESFGVTVIARGFARALREVDLHGARQEPQAIRIRLHPGATLAGVVEDRQGRAVASADVYVYPDGDDDLSIDPRGSWSDGVRYVIALGGRSGRDGRFEVHGLALDARYAATAFAPRYPRAEDVKGITAGTSRSAPDVRLVLPDPATLRVTVRDEEGDPLPGARVSCRSTARGVFLGGASKAADAAGRAVLSGLGAGEGVVRAEASGFLLEDRRVVLAEGQSEQVELRLRRGATVSGIVVDMEDRPLEGVQVSARSVDGLAAYARTDEEGRFDLVGFAPGPVELRAGGAGHVLPASLRVTAPARNVRLECVGATRVRGRLVLPPGATPPERIQVGLFEPSGAGSAREVPWNAGRFEVALDGEPWILRIHGVSFAPYERPVHPAVGTTLDLGDVPLSPGVTCRGTVVDASGTPVAGAVVTAVAHEWRTTQTDERGRFELENLQATHLSLSVEAQGYLGRWVRLHPEAATLDRRILLAQGGLLRVRVLDGEGLAVVATSVTIVPADVTKEEDAEAYYTRWEWGETDEQGRLELRMVPGPYRIEVDRDEMAPLTETATLREGETTEVELRP